MQYDSLAEAVEALASLYVAVLLRLVTTKRLEIFVHPVPPVLIETRPVVMAFNEILREHVSAAAERLPRRAGAAGGGLAWLEFCHGLLEAAPAGSSGAGGADNAAEGDGGTTAERDVVGSAKKPAGQQRLRLRPEFELDGTHLAPAYLQLLQQALDAASAQEN
jgi:hypothetical protein